MAGVSAVGTAAAGTLVVAAGICCVSAAATVTAGAAGACGAGAEATAVAPWW